MRRRRGSVRNVAWVSFVVVDWGSSQCLRLVSDQDGDIDVGDNINGHFASHRSGNRDVHGHLHGVLHDLWHGDRNGNWHLHLHRAFDLLGHNNVVRSGHGHRHGARNSHLAGNVDSDGHTNSVHFLDGDNHGLVLGDGVWRVDRHLSGLHDVHGNRDVHLLNHVSHSGVSLRHADFLRNGLGLVNWHLHLVRDNLIDRNNNLHSSRNFNLVDNLHLLRDINRLGLSDLG